MARRQSVASQRPGLFRAAERLGINRGVFGGNKGWFYLGSGLWTLRTMRRLAERKQETLISEELKPGQRLVIANGRATIDEVGGAVDDPGGGSKRRRRR